MKYLSEFRIKNFLYNFRHKFLGLDNSLNLEHYYMLYNVNIEFVDESLYILEISNGCKNEFHISGSLFSIDCRLNEDTDICIIDLTTGNIFQSDLAQLFRLYHYYNFCRYVFPSDSSVKAFKLIDWTGHNYDDVSEFMENWKYNIRGFELGNDNYVNCGSRLKYKVKEECWCSFVILLSKCQLLCTI